MTIGDRMVLCLSFPWSPRVETGKRFEANPEERCKTRFADYSCGKTAPGLLHLEVAPTTGQSRWWLIPKFHSAAENSPETSSLVSIVLPDVPPSLREVRSAMAASVRVRKAWSDVIKPIVFHTIILKVIRLFPLSALYFGVLPSGLAPDRWWQVDSFDDW